MEMYTGKELESTVIIIHLPNIHITMKVGSEISISIPIPLVDRIIFYPLHSAYDASGIIKLFFFK